MRAPAAITGLFRNTVVAVLCLLPALRALPVHAEASSGVAIRAGNHTGFGRIVFDVASGTRYKLNRDGDTVTIEFSDNTALLKPPPAPTNVRSLKAAAERADIVVAAGAALREMRIDGHGVIDVLDPTATSPPAAKAVKPAAEPPKPKPEPAQAKAVPPAPLPPERQAAKQAEPPVVKPAELPAAKPAEPPAAAKAVKPAVEPPKPKPEPAQAKAVPPAPLPPERQAAKPAEPLAVKPQEEHVAALPSFTPVPGPIALVAAPVIPPEGVAFTVPLGPKAGAAVFRRGSNFFVVFDERRPIDLAALRDDSVFGSAYVRELQSGTLVTLQPPPGTGVALAQTATGWKIVVRPDVQAARAIPYAPKDGHLDLPAEAPGNVVSMADPNSGATLLVGTHNLLVPRDDSGLDRRRPGRIDNETDGVWGSVLYPTEGLMLYTQAHHALQFEARLAGIGAGAQRAQFGFRGSGAFRIELQVADIARRKESFGQFTRSLRDLPDGTL